MATPVIYRSPSHYADTVHLLSPALAPTALAQLAYALTVPEFAPRSSKWGKVRKAHLAQHSVCAACGSRQELQVHHVKPYHLFPDLELDPGNLITLCQMPSRLCHFIFGHHYNWTLYNHDVRTEAANHLASVARTLREQELASIPLPEGGQ